MNTVNKVTESRGVDSHVSGTPQAGSRDQVTPRQLHAVAPPRCLSGYNKKLTNQRPLSYTSGFLADRTATQYDRLLASSCRPSVRPSVCNAVHYGSRGRCTRLKVVPACS